MTAEALLTALRARGVELRAVGDRLRFRPAELVAPDEVEALRRFKPVLLALLSPATVPHGARQAGEPEEPAPTLAPVAARPGPYAWPWPDRLPGLGARRMCAFSPCDNCNPAGEPSSPREPAGAAWSWVAYGPRVLCLVCARRRAPGPERST